jgi:hypothetical protein
MTHTTHRRWVALLVLVCLPVLGGSHPVTAPQTGAPAPDFVAETIDGKRIGLADYKGKSAVLLNFYANF